MRFKGRMEFEQGLKQIELAPLINIMFLLLVFLLLSSSFISQPGMKINLPKAITSEVIKHGNIVITITADNSIFLEGKPVTSEGLEAFFKQIAARNQTVLIKADSRVSLGRAVEIWDMARSLGISQINIATNKE